MKGILKYIGMYLIKQQWFQFAIVKMITKTIHDVRLSENKVDDAIVNFIIKHKEPILQIVSEEAKCQNTPIDHFLVQAISFIK